MCLNQVFRKPKTLVNTRPTPKTLPSAAAQGTVFMSRNRVFTLIPSLPFNGQPSNKAQTKQPKFHRVHPGRPWFLSLLDYDIIPCVQGTPWYLWFSIFLVPNILASLPCPWGRHFWDRQGTAPLHPTWSSCHDLKHFGRCCCCTLETTNTRQTEYNENTLYHFSVNRSLTFRPLIV